jgi:hypothetical protein
MSWVLRKVSGSLVELSSHTTYLSRRISSESQYERQLKIWGIRKNWKKKEWFQTTRFFANMDLAKVGMVSSIEMMGLLEEIFARLSQSWPSKFLVSRV